MAIGIPELLVLLAIAASFAIILWPAARICRRIGYSPWLASLAIVPFGNVLLLWFIALAEWPVERGTAGRRRP